MPVPKGTRIGGRQKGTPNKVANDLKALAQKHTPAAINRLVEHMNGPDPKASVAACKEILDRGHGKATQLLGGDPNGEPIRLIVATGIDRPPNAA